MNYFFKDRVKYISHDSMVIGLELENTPAHLTLGIHWAPQDSKGCWRKWTQYDGNYTYSTS